MVAARASPRLLLFQDTAMRSKRHRTVPRARCIPPTHARLPLLTQRQSSTFRAATAADPLFLSIYCTTGLRLSEISYALSFRLTLQKSCSAVGRDLAASANTVQARLHIIIDQTRYHCLLTCVVLLAAAAMGKQKIVTRLSVRSTLTL